MKKMFFASLALAAVIGMTAAASDLYETSFADAKEGALDLAEAPFVQVERTSGSFTDDTLYIWWKQPELLRTFSETWNEKKSADSTFPNEDDLEWTIYLQTDCKVDNGDWQYTKSWDEFDHEYDGYELRPPFDHAIMINPGDENVICHAPLAFLNAIFDDESNACFFAGTLVRQSVDDDARFRLDLAEHTFYVRCRYFIRHITGKDTDELFIGEWSPVTSFGKKGTQSTLIRPKKLDAPVISDLAVETKDGATWIVYSLETPQNVSEGEMFAIIDEGLYDTVNIETQYRVADGKWQDTYTEDSTVLTSGTRLAAGLSDVTETAPLDLRIRFVCKHYGLTSDWSDTLSINEVKWEKASDWAIEELLSADELGLIPGILSGEDLTKAITREEFAAVSVKVYEALSGKEAVIEGDNPFEDTDSEDVLKAYSAGFTAGMSETEFAPDTLLNREQAATMLTRVYKKVGLDGWTLETDGSFTKQFKKLFVMPDPFADDEFISDWAKDSVYFMSAFGIVGGMGDGTFAPRNVTPEQEASGYANATREQALLIAVRMVENLG